MKAIFFLIVLFTVTACGSDNSESINAQKASSVREDVNLTTSSRSIPADTESSTIESNHFEEEDNHTGESDGTEEADTPEEDVESVVYIETGAVQCDPNGVSKEETAELLTVNGITVLDSQCGDLSGVVFASQCGMPSPDINLHTIPTESLSAAISLGFKPASALEQEDDAGYVMKDCRLPPQ